MENIFLKNSLTDNGGTGLFIVHIGLQRVTFLLGTRAKFGLTLLGPASNWPQLKAAGGNGRPQKMPPTQVTSSNRTVVAKMFWMLWPAPIIKFQDNRLKPHNALIL